MKKSTKKRFAGLASALVLATGLAVTASAYYGGDSLCGASSYEVLQVKYNGAAWNYAGSGYSYAWFKYTRNGKTLLYKYTNSGKVTGSVWDDLIHWGDAYTTNFKWDRG